MYVIYLPKVSLWCAVDYHPIILFCECDQLPPTVRLVLHRKEETVIIVRPVGWRIAHLAIIPEELVEGLGLKEKATA